MDFSSLSDEELLKPDAAGGNVRPSDISTLSDEELLKPDGDQPKPELGMFERMGLEKQAQTGKDASVLDFLPVVGGIRQAEQNRQEAMEQKLFSGEYRDTLEASGYALSLGIPQEEVRRINGLGDDAAIRKGFSDAVKDRFAARIRSREEAQRKLQGAKEAGTLEKIASGTITGGAMVAEFANPLTMAAGTAGKIINSVGGVGKDIYILDQKGKPVLAKDENGNDLRGDRSEWAAAKAIAGGYAEQTIWTAMGIKQLGSIGVKLIDKIPGVNKLAAATVGKISGTAEKIIGEIASTEGGRIALKTGEVIGKVNDKLHFGSLPDMIYKTRLTELTQNVMGMGVREEDRQSFGQWLDDFTSVEGNAELLTGIIGIHLLTAGYGALKARGAERTFRHLDANGMEGGREEVVAEYIGAEKAKQLSDVDLDNIYRLVTSPDLTEAKINDFLDKMNRDQAEAQKKISSGESISSVIEGIREKMSAGSQGVRTAAERIKETLENKAKLTPEMEDALDGKIAEYTQDLGTSGGAVAKMVKDDILANVKDNAVYEQPDMLDELVAMSMRKFNGDGRRLRIHDVRGEKNAGEQLKTINELGITSWEQAEAEGLVTRDKYGRLGGGARRALNIALHGTEKLQKAVKDGTISGELAEDLMTAAQCELGARPVEEQTALVDGILDRAKGDEALARRMLEKLEAGTEARQHEKLDERLDRVADEAKVDAIKERNGAADEMARGAAVEPVETEDGQIKTVGEVVDAGSAAGQTAEPKPTTALGGAEQADRLAGTKLTVFNGTTMGCETFPEAKVNVSADGVTVRGLTADTMAKPENVADVAAFMTHLMRISKRNGIRIEFEDADATKIAQALVTEISQQGAAKTMAKLETRGKLFGLLFKTTLGNGVTYDEASFKEALKNVNNGRQFVDNHGDVYGFIDGNGVLHFNPATFNMDTPIHEYGHLALEATKKINNALWKRGMSMIRNTGYYAQIKALSEKEGSGYEYLRGNEELLRDEALAQMIGDRGARLVEDRGLDAQLKNWLKEIWKAFNGALGIADLTEEQIESMSIHDFVHVINAELLKGGEFGTKKRTPPTEKSIKRYDEDRASGSNGVLRWKNDRGYLFAIPVDMERTQPGGKVVFATDDANITDWIQNALNGYELRLSKTGKLYVKGRDGLPDELAEIFGRYPTIGQNDGIYELIASETGNRAMAGAARDMTPEALVEALRADRARYDEWTQGRDAEAEHLAMEEARANAEAASRWEQSGMSVMDYIRSRVEEGDPEFDLDWETAREMEHDRAMGRFSIASTLSTGRASTAEYQDSHGNKRILQAVIGDAKHGRTKIARKHCVDFGTATTGGFSLDEIARYEQDILANGIKRFDKATGRRTITWKSPDGVTFHVGTFITGRGPNEQEVINTVHTDRNAKETLRLKKEIGAAKKLSQTQGLHHQGNAIPAVTTEALKSSRELTAWSIPKSDSAGNGGKFSVGRGTADPDLAFDPSMIVYNPKLKAMGEMEQNAGGIAAAIEKKEALRPWTRKDSPCDLAKPIAMDCADMVQLFRAVSGSVKNPIIRKGEHIPGRPNAIGLNRGGTQIELANRLFGMVDASDVGKLKTDCANDGYFRHENPDWCAAQTKDAVKAEAERSQDELDRRTRELIRHRVATGEGGMHYATQVLGHEIGHTIATLPADRNLGAVGNAMRTLYDALQREMKRAADPLRVKKGEPNLTEEIDNLITWWHGADTLPDYYKKPKEKFAELFGIFLTQPESVHREAPKAYEAIVQMMGKNERLALAYRRITEAKWSGKSNERVMADIERTWTKEQQEQFRELERLAREPISKARDWFNFALNDRFGPMFAISQRSLAAEKKHLARAVKEGAMSQQEANDRIKARQDEIDALKTALFDWQRQTGGSTRLMMADLDDVIRTAQRDGVNWNDVRMYAHLNRVIELGGRATAHGVDPSRAAAMLGDMARKLGAEKWSLVEKAWKAYRAVYERHALEDPNVAEMFDAETNKMLYANKHYVTMKHRMGAEETAEWLAKVEAYKKGNQDAWDPTIDLWNRMNRGLKGQSGINAGFKLYRLEGSFEATEDPIAATMKTAIDLKENAARNHLLKTMSQTLRDLGVKGVYDTALADGAKEHAVDPNVYERLTYMDGGIRHELIVPRVIGASFTTRRALPRAVDFIGGTMRFLRNTMTLWNPAFINRAYLIDKSSLETNIKGLHKPAIDILSEALCFRGIGVPLYMANNYLTRFTPIANTWLGKILWNEHTVNHYAHRAQKIARMIYEGRFTDRLEDARKLRELGRTGEATEIEQNVAIAQEMLKKNVFQSLYEFNVKQSGLNTAEILEKFGYQIEGGQNPKSWRGRMWERTKNGARIYNRFEEEQEAVTKIVAYLYRMKMDEQAGRTSAKDADARARLVIEQGGTPNLSARGVFASAIENATGFFWNVRKEGFLRTIDALKDHPTEWISKNFAQTAMPALLKGLIATGCAELLIRKFFDDDEEKIKESWWAPAVLDHCRFVNSAMKCVPGYYQRNYNVIPIAKFGNEVLSMRVKYSPEEFAIQNAIHTAMQKFGADPTDPSADWSTLKQNMMTEFLPNIFGQNYALDALGALVGPLVGINPYDQYRERKIYDENTFRARAKMPGRMAKEMVKSFWNYSPLGSFGGKLKDGLERKDVNDEIPGWLDGILSTPFVKMLPASMLTITSDDSYVRGLQEVDKEQRAAVMVAAQDILVDCIKRGSLGGFTEGLKDVPGDYRMLAVRHVLNGWKQWNMDPRMKQLKTIRGMKDVELKRRAWQMLKDGERFQD